MCQCTFAHIVGELRMSKCGANCLIGDCNVPEAERVPGKCAWLPPFEAGSFLSRGGAAGQSGGGERFFAGIL